MLRVGGAYRPMRAALSMALARAWKIETVPDQSSIDRTWRFTSWTRNTTVIEETGDWESYSAGGLVIPGPHRAKTGFGENSGQLRVIIGTGATPITVDEVQSGILDGAKVTRYTFDPLRPWLEPIRAERFRVEDLGEGARSVTLNLVGVSALFRNRSGIDLGPTCRNDFGDGFCNWGGAIDASAEFAFRAYRAESIAGGNTRRSFRMRGGTDFFPAASLTDANWWSHGLVRFLDGRNAGVLAIIESNTQPIDMGGYYACDVELATPIAQPPEFNALLSVRVGCDGHFETCRLKFANVDNFRGAKDMPGTDALRTTGAAE